MNKRIVPILLFIFILIFLLCGCSEQKNINDSSPKTVNWNAQEYIDDFRISSSLSGGEWKWKYSFDTLDEGDTLILSDKISNISYTEFLINSTSINFKTENYSKMGVSGNEVAFLFEGNITDRYFIDDNVKITLTIKDFEFKNESSGFNIEMEGYAEGSDLEEIPFSFFTQILPESCIIKL